MKKLKLENHIFDVLLWWKVNSPRFPLLSEIARDVLAIPVSSVASECAFSTGGRILDSFRSSLTPKLVQALVCLQDWLRSEPQPISIEEDLDFLEQLEEDFIMPRLYGSNARSPVWNHYEKIEEKEDGSWTVKCVHCGRVTYYHSHKTGVASLRKHVKRCEEVDMLDGVTVVRPEKVKYELVLDGNDIELVSWSVALINQVEGGGWCNNVTTCLSRKNTHLGSSKQMVENLAFSGILSNRPQFNPDLYNWNRVKVGYCDGSSFTGDVQAVNPAILSGCGLTSILHCDSFKALLPMGAKVKSFSDAGFCQESAASVCTSRLKPDLMKNTLAPGLADPHGSDTFIKNILAPGVADPYGFWLNCKLDILECSSRQLQIMHDQDSNPSIPLC
ncbi:hypothetical protein KY285_025523 [Solanum tuberosum]|nr:hypothetical protein KY289_024411 [Solanum tuberosum]KAH0677722.1 hypothetical protein KY285_025523 [Solanum tuberosum]